MPYYYFDTSALLKKYFLEPGGRVVKEIFMEEAVAYTSSVTYAEVYSSFARQYREGALSEDSRREKSREFEGDWEELLDVLDFTSAVRLHIPNLLNHVPLRGADAVHLATAEALKSRGLDPIFVSSDLRLINGAKQSGFKVMNPERK